MENKRFSSVILAWYNKNKRDLPWRNTSNPYYIWLSEIILQQTRVDQGLNYYLNFVKHFPNIKQLAQAKNEKVMKLWQGLGYYSRARNLHEAAKHISEKYKGQFPNTYDDILSLKGVGVYTAAAIASFAYNLPYAVVDGNVYRVLSRVFGIQTPIDSTQGKKEFNELANELLDKKNPATYNQAIMEFGAMYCKPSNPDCNNCVLNIMCYAFEKKQVNNLPVKSKKTKVRNRYFNYILLNHKNNIIINKRTAKDIWINLYDFPLFETSEKLTEQQFLKSKDWKKFIGNTKYSIKQVSIDYKHILSHQKIYARFWEVELTEQIQLNNPFAININRKKIDKYPVPRLIELYLNKLNVKIN